MNNELKRLQIEKATIADDEHNEIIKTMTPQEKAKELFNKFCYEIRTEERGDGYFTNVIQAKQCALIAVDEIISVIDPETNYKTWEFYKQVKQEIKKL